VINLSRRRWALYLGASFLAGVAAAIVVPWMVARAADRILPDKLTEIARVTSPDGAVDAVMIQDNCGALCSYGYTVFIVPKGESAPRDFKRQLFSADDMAGEKLVWKQPHLLEIVYSKARIYAFRNISYPFGEFGSKPRSWDYKVEIQLAPSSAGFSYLEAKDLR